MKYPRVLLASFLAFVGLGIGPRTAMAASDPVIQGTQEMSVPGGGGRILLVYGRDLTKITSYELDQPGGTVIGLLTVVIKGKTLTGLALPSNLVYPAFALPANFSLKFTTKTATDAVLIRLTGGRAENGGVGSTALETTLRTDLDNAVMVGGQTLGNLHDAGLLTGSLPTSVFSAYDDLVAESKVGTGAAQVAAGDHVHDARYPLRTDLNTVGTINKPGNPVQWSQLVGVPAGLADGVDDTGGTAYTAGNGLTLTAGVFSVNFAGNGAALTLARSDHNHDASYYTQAQLNASGGTINASGNPVDWTRLKGVPAGFADGIDNDTTYTNGTGLGLAGTTFSVNFGGTGSATTSSRSDHNHATTYLNLAGGTLTGPLTISSSSQAVIATSGTSSGTAGGIDCTTSNGIGVAGHGNVGVLGDLDSDGSFGVEGRGTYSNQVGVYAYASGANGIALKANSNTGTYYGTAVYVTKSGNGDALVVKQQGSGNLAVFITNGYNKARIDNAGTGRFNGGTYSYGADFAESVKVDRPSSAFEPGDVMVIDPKAPRQFALSAEANSALVAGVISTRPAVVGTTHKVAGEETAWKSGEVKLGIVGIVPTKICDEGGSIRIGDLLVTSSVPGHAKKAPPNPAVGTVIGRALGALDSGRGKIEVLLMAR